MGSVLDRRHYESTGSNRAVYIPALYKTAGRRGDNKGKRGKLSGH